MLQWKRGRAEGADAIHDAASDRASRKGEKRCLRPIAFTDDKALARPRHMREYKEGGDGRRKKRSGQCSQ